MDDKSLKVASVVPVVKVADCDSNVDNIITICEGLNQQEIKLAIFPELTITGCTCGDLFRSEILRKGGEVSLIKIAEASSSWDMALVVGAIITYNGLLYNCGVLINKGEIVVAVPQNNITDTRHFAPGGELDTIITIGNQLVPLVGNRIVTIDDVNVSIIVGEHDDLSQLSGIKEEIQGLHIVANLGAHIAVMGKSKKQIDKILELSAQKKVSYIYAGAGYGESTTDNVYDGAAIIAQNGSLLAINEKWQTSNQLVVANVAYNYDVKEVHTHTEVINSKIYSNPYIPTENVADEYCSDAVNIQMLGLMRRLEVTRCKNLVIGISGGLDSTLALLVAVKTFDKMGIDRKGIIGVTMPGFGTTDRTYNNALVMMRSLGITMMEIPIANAVTQHFSDIKHDISIHDITYENSQARERTQILMDLSNKVCGMVLGTGDLSELALGWATYNGDHMSMYGINAGIPKTLVRRLVKWIADNEEDKDCQNALLDVIDTPISPELVPADENGLIKQKTEDLVGPYELHDFFIYYVLNYGYSPSHIYSLAKDAFMDEYDPQIIKHWLTVFFRRFFTQQFKRSCMPDGPAVCGISLSPRGAWQMPSDASSAMWIKECEQLN